MKNYILPLCSLTPPLPNIARRLLINVSSENTKDLLQSNRRATRQKQNLFFFAILRTYHANGVENLDCRKN